MGKRRSQNKLQGIGDILQEVLKKKRIPFYRDDRRMVGIWEKTAGPQIAAQSMPENIKKNVLFVRVSSSVWMHQLHFLKGELVEKFNALMEKETIRDIRFSIGHIPSPPGKVKGPELLSLPASLLKERDKKMMAACLASLADEELKDILQRVMAREITRRRFRERKVP